MEALALVPGLFAAAVALRHGPERAFISVYVPVLFFLPDFYRWIAPGLPDPTFSQAAIIPIAGVFLLKGSKDWTLSLTDLVADGNWRSPHRSDCSRPAFGAESGLPACDPG